jgi:hypothetical protein
MLFAAVHESADTAACPELAKADVRSAGSDSPFDPSATMRGSGLLLCKLTIKPHSVARISLL